MADSDDEYERRKARDKFRRERNDYDHRRDDRRRDWDHDRSSDRYDSRSWRGRESSAGRRDPYGRDYDRRDRRYSPPRRDMSPPHKRMRREWDDMPPYDMPHYGSSMMSSRGHQQHWGHGHSMGPPQDGGYGAPGQAGQDPDYPTQPPMMSFKMFLGQQDDTISDSDAVKKYNEYKEEFKKQQINEFFLQHKEEEWFKSKYHPEEFEKRQEEVRKALKKRCDVFFDLLSKGWFEGITVDTELHDKIVKLLDAAVIKMEGGEDEDLKALDEPDIEEGSRSRNNSETVEKSSPEKKKESQPEPTQFEEQSVNDHDVPSIHTTTEEPPRSANDTQTILRKPEMLSLGLLGQYVVVKYDGVAYPGIVLDIDEDDVEVKKPLELPITEEQKELAKKAQEFSKKQQEAQNGDDESPKKDEDGKKGKKKKRHRDKQEYSYESGSESESDSGSSSDSEPEPAPPGLEDEGGDKEEKKEEEKEEKEEKDDKEEKSSKEETAEKKDDEEKDKDTKKEEGKKEEEKIKRKMLHKTSSIFLRNLAPSITKQEVEAVCKRYPGFVRVALQDPQPERRFLRRGWVTFDKSVNIKEICWNLNNIRLRDCDLGATLNRELKQRVRPVSGMTGHAKVVRQDIKLAAKIIQNFDDKWRIWEESGAEKKDSEKEFSLSAKNPCLKNITDYLVDEGSYEEDELLGLSTEEGEKEDDPEIKIERDETLLKVLDKMILYLRVVHSIDYYSANEYPNEDEMPHRCGIMHARGIPPSTKTTKKDLDDWLKNFENKVKPFVELQDKLDDEASKKMGRKDPEAEVEKFVTANTQELAKDKWLCPISGKKFKGPEFVRKHIFNKHGEKIEEVKQEVSFFNNYLQDPKRPSLPEHPGNKGSSTQSPGQQGQPYPSPAGYGAPQQGMMGYNSMRGGHSHHMMRGGYSGSSGYYGQQQQHSSAYNHRLDPYNSREREDPRSRQSTFTRPYSRGGGSRRGRRVIEYKDLDAPEEGDFP